MGRRDQLVRLDDMRTLVQTVRHAAVTRVQNGDTQRIGEGVCISVAIARLDTVESGERLCRKLLSSLWFPLAGKPFAAALAPNTPILVISNFTLLGDHTTGRRPSWSNCAPPEQAHSLLHGISQSLRGSGMLVTEGYFGEEMLVSVENWGPTNILFDC